MKLSDSEKALLYQIIEDVEDKFSWENYLEVYDGDFDSAMKDVNDSIGGALANAALAIAEQKKLLQSAKTPQALQTALKLIAVTGGNLLHAGSSLLSWMSRKLPQRDSAMKDANDSIGGALSNLLSWMSRKLPQRDSAATETYANIISDDYDMVVTDSDKAGRKYAVIHRKGMKDYVISCGYDEETGDFGTVFGGFKTSDAAVEELGRMLKK